MQLMMSEGLEARVGDQSLRTRQAKVIANLNVGETSFSLPVVHMLFESMQLLEISLGVQDVSLLKQLITSEDSTLIIDNLNLNCKNIFSGTYKLLEHSNYGYQLVLNLEQKDA